MNRIFEAYFQAAQTLPKTRQVVMLYDGAIKFMVQARDAIPAGDIESCSNALTKAGNIIFGLHGCLDFNQGGNISMILDSFYSTIFAEINEIQTTRSATKCDEIIAELKAMRESWAEIDSKTSTQTSNTMAGIANAFAPASAKPQPANPGQTSYVFSA